MQYTTSVPVRDSSRHTGSDMWGLLSHAADLIRYQNDQKGGTVENPWKPACIALAALLVLSIFLGISGAYGGIANPSLFTSTVSKEAVAQNAVDFISANYLNSGVTAGLVNVTETNGVYKTAIRYSSSEGEQVTYVYLTRDGSLLFPSAYPLTARAGGVVKKTVEESCAALTRQDDAALEAFVVSYCPYGTQMQGVLADVVKGVPDLAKHITVRYIGQVTNGTVQSMHGSTEAAENLRQICIREEQPQAYWQYVACFINSTSSSSCFATAGVDESRLTACMSDEERGIRYAQDDFSRADGYSATGSPTLVLNGATVSEFDFGGRNPEAVKTLLCCGFSAQPGSCATRLSNVTTGMSQGGC